MNIYLISRRLAGALIIAFCLAPWLEAREPQTEVAVERDVMVPMRDGVKLATDLYRPSREGQPLAERGPVILTRLPYDKTGAKRLGEYFAAHGYVFVAQDTRGRFGSEGVWHFMTDDGQRRLGLRGMDRPPAVVERQDRDDGHLVRRRHAARDGARKGAAARDGDPGGCGVEHGPAKRAQCGRVRAAVLELDHAQRGPGQPRVAGSGHGGGAQGNGGRALYVSAAAARCAPAPRR